jgi:hypothetical protein
MGQLFKLFKLSGQLFKLFKLFKLSGQLFKLFKLSGQQVPGRSLISNFEPACDGAVAVIASHSAVVAFDCRSFKRRRHWRLSSWGPTGMCGKASAQFTAALSYLEAVHQESHRSRHHQFKHLPTFAMLCLSMPWQNRVPRAHELCIHPAGTLFLSPPAAGLLAP